MPEYTVLRNLQGDVWIELGPVKAKNTTEAITKMARVPDLHVAVALRNFKPKITGVMNNA